MTREIELIFYENPDSAVLFWTLLFLKEEYYNNSAYKLKAIHSWVMNGCASPYLYVEAYYLIWQEPYLLSSLGEFEVRILRWAIRHHALTRELAAQIFEIVEVNKGFDRIHFALLEAAYEVEPEPEKVGFICSYLIRAQKFDAKYHHWFEAGIELELRITSLYEAYLLSFDEREIGSVPKIIQMYFQYDSNLPYRKMAILYNNIIASKDNHPEIYQQYRRIMGRFAMEQLEQEHMDDNLAVLYEEMLDLGLVNEELAHCLAQILFTHKLVLFDKRMVRAIIYQKQMAEPQIVPIVERAAYFQLYSDTYVVLFEDEKGKRYVNSVSYRMESLMEPEPYLEKCMSLAPDELPYLIAYFEKKKEEGSISKEDEKYFPRILFAKELDPTYQARLARQILQYYETTGQQTVVQEYLAQVDLEPMPQSVRQYMLDQMVHYRMYEQSYEHLVYYGIDQMGVAERVTLASDRIRQQENGEDADEQLLLLCTSVFVRKKYNDSILKYLSDFYYGPTEQMLRLWRAARAFEIDTFELEERILVQILYSDADLTDAEEIFVHYYENGGRELMILAYLTMGAHRYFVEQTKIPVSVPKILCDRYQNGRELNDACKLALLKLLSEEEVGGEDSYRMQEELLAEYTCRNMNFAFYKKLDKRLVQKYHLYDKVFLEYRTDPRKRVILHYSREEDGENFVTVDMQDVYDGIFVEPFILFFGESVQYYITEEFGNEVEVTESNRLTGNDYYAQKDESRYNLINQMLMSEMLSDEKALHQKMKQYAEYDVVTQKVFKLL